MVAAVITQTYVFGQTIQISRHFTVRLVVGNCVGNLFERLEALWVLVEKRLNLTMSLLINSGRNIDQHQSLCGNLSFAYRNKTSGAPHRSPDQDWRLAAERLNDHVYIVDHMIDTIVTGIRPTGISVPSCIKCYCVITGCP